MYNQQSQNSSMLMVYSKVFTTLKAVLAANITHKFLHPALQ